MNKKLLNASIALFLAASYQNSYAQQAAQIFLPITNPFGGAPSYVPISSTNPLPISISGTSNVTINFGTSAATTNPRITGDATSGLYTAGADQVGIAISGVQRLNATTTGITLTGTTTTGSINASNQLTIAYSGPAILMQNTASTTDTKNWVIGASSSNLLGYVLNDTASVQTNWLTVDRSGTTISDIKLSTGATPGSTAITILQGGAVGIGTTTPQAALDVGNTSGSAFRVVPTASEVDYIQVTGGVTGTPGTVTISAVGTDTNINLSLAAKGTGVLSTGIINATGNSVITNNGVALSVVGNSTNAIDIEFNNTVSSGQDWFIGSTGASGIGLSVGSFAIYNSSTGNKLNIAANGAATLANAVLMPGLSTSSASTTGTVCWTTGTGNLTVDTTTTCLLSSLRFKKDIQPINDALSEIIKMKPISFVYKDPAMGKDRLSGLIAEEVYPINKTLVELDKDGNPYKIRYEGLTALNTKAIQQLEEKISNGPIRNYTAYNTFWKRIMWLIKGE